MFTKEIYITSYDGELDKLEVIELFKTSDFHNPSDLYRIEFFEADMYDEWIIYKIEII